MNRAPAALVVMCTVLPLSACDEARRLGVKLFSPTYSAPDMGGVPDAHAAEKKTAFRLVPVVEGVEQPTDLQFVPGRDDVLVVAEKTGRARVFKLVDGGNATPLKDLLKVDVRTESELGLLGIAFHPRFAENGRVFVHDTPAEGAMRSRVTEWHVVPADAGVKAATPTRTVLEVTQPYQNHNAGQLAFGPDGFLYVGYGDGGFRADPNKAGQDTRTLLGKMLRLDVDNIPPRSTYGIPADNPFINAKDARPEIYATGLRNPWRFSFDSTGRLWVADVGQDAFEEVDLVTRGANLGWSVKEGLHCFDARTCDATGLTDPVAEYGRDMGQSITGGFLVEDDALPVLKGRYLCADFVSGRFLAFSPPADGKGPVKMTEVARHSMLPSTFGRDARGRLYVADFGRGTVHRLAAP